MGTPPGGDRFRLIRLAGLAGQHRWVYANPPPTIHFVVQTPLGTRPLRGPRGVRRPLVLRFLRHEPTRWLVTGARCGMAIELPCLDLVLAPNAGFRPFRGGLGACRNSIYPGASKRARWLVVSRSVPRRPPERRHNREPQQRTVAPRDGLRYEGCWLRRSRRARAVPRTASQVTDNAVTRPANGLKVIAADRSLSAGLGFRGSSALGSSASPRRLRSCSTSRWKKAA